MKVIIDTREQRPVLYGRVGDPKYPGLEVVFRTLKTGDYSIEGMDSPDRPHSITIERKSLPDLYQSCGRERNRFKREFERMLMFDFAGLVTEADIETIIKNPPLGSKMEPKAVLHTVIAFCQRYNVHWYPCKSRRLAERIIYLLLKRFWDDRQPGNKMNI